MEKNTIKRIYLGISALFFLLFAVMLYLITKELQVSPIVSITDELWAVAFFLSGRYFYKKVK